MNTSVTLGSVPTLIFFILLPQFSDENAEKMKQAYGEFCSHHIEAVNVFKELQQQNKKFQTFVRVSAHPQMLFIGIML